MYACVVRLFAKTGKARQVHYSKVTKRAHKWRYQRACERAHCARQVCSDMMKGVKAHKWTQQEEGEILARNWRSLKKKVLAAARTRNQSGPVEEKIRQMQMMGVWSNGVTFILVAAYLWGK
eukprot:347532-Amphidinium_carterae.2